MFNFKLVVKQPSKCQLFVLTILFQEAGRFLNDFDVNDQIVMLKGEVYLPWRRGKNSFSNHKL